MTRQRYNQLEQNELEHLARFVLIARELGIANTEVLEISDYVMMKIAEYPSTGIESFLMVVGDKL